MAEFSQVLALLRNAVAHPATLPSLVPQFQELVWHSEMRFPNEPAQRATRDLAYDLEYYVPDPRRGAEDPLYFGEERAVAEIRSALRLMQTEEGV